MRRLAFLLMAGCASSPDVERWGREVAGTADYDRRVELVGKIIDSGDPRAIPVLIDDLHAAIELNKLKPRDPSAVKPWTCGPELWGLIVLTHQDHDRDLAAWRRWWEAHRAELVWDPAERCFKPR